MIDVTYLWNASGTLHFQQHYHLLRSALLFTLIANHDQGFQNGSNLILKI